MVYFCLIHHLCIASFVKHVYVVALNKVQNTDSSQKIVKFVLSYYRVQKERDACWMRINWSIIFYFSLLASRTNVNFCKCSTDAFHFLYSSFSRISIVAYAFRILLWWHLLMSQRRICWICNDMSHCHSVLGSRIADDRSL